MPVLSFHPDQLQPAYGIACRRVFPDPGLATPFGATDCEVAPGQSTTPHRHHEGETFYIAQGTGRMQIAGEPERLVSAGDVVYIPAHTEHRLTNDTNEPLRFLSVWWADQANQMADLPARTLVYTAPPTPNGDLHLGHLSGPYLAADLHARFLRMQQVDVRLHSGTDDNQTYVSVKGQTLGLTPEAVTERFGNAIAGTLEAFGVTMDHFLRPTRTPAYRLFVQAFFERLRDGGHVRLHEADSLHCRHCDLYLFEAYVSGGCPHCGAATNGNGCEQCYHFNDCVDLIDPVCNHCKQPASRTTVPRYYFPLAEHGDVLRRFHAETAMSPHLQALATELLADGLPAISVSHVADWGIPVPGQDGQVFYDWFEMAAGFLFSAGQMAPDSRWEHFWKSAESEVVQCFGFDNAFFFTTLLPALLLAYDPEIRLPKAMLSNEFYQLEGSKFSTSRRHAIWADQAIAHVPVDVLRFFLSFDRPQQAQTSFSLSHLRSLVQQELVAQWEAWLADLDRVLDETGMRSVPALPERALLTPEQGRFLTRLHTLTREVAEGYSAAAFAPRRVARKLNELVQVAREFHVEQAHLAAVPGLAGQWQAAIALQLAAARTLALLAAPMLPEFSTRLLAALGEAIDQPLRWAPVVTPLPADRRVGRLQDGSFTAALHGIDALALVPIGG